MTANVGKDGRPYIARKVFAVVPVTVQVKVLVNGREEVRNQTVPQYQERQEHLYLDSDKVQVSTTDGKRVDVKNLRLQGPTAVLVSANGRPVDPLYTRLAREGTLVVVTPNIAAPAMVPPPPVKVPAPK